MEGFGGELSGVMGRKCVVVNACLKGSTIVEWYYLFLHDFVEAGRDPGVVVINLSAGHGVGRDLPVGSIRVNWLAGDAVGGLGGLGGAGFRGWMIWRGWGEYKIVAAWSRWDLRRDAMGWFCRITWGE